MENDLVVGIFRDGVSVSDVVRQALIFVALCGPSTALFFWDRRNCRELKALRDSREGNT